MKRLLAAAAALALAVGLSVAASPAEKADAYALTYVHNNGGQTFTVVKDNGQRINLSPGQGAWGVSFAYIGAWQCLYGTVSKCGSGAGTVVLYFGVGQYYERLVNR